MVGLEGEWDYLVSLSCCKFIPVNAKCAEKLGQPGFLQTLQTSLLSWGALSGRNAVKIQHLFSYFCMQKMGDPALAGSTQMASPPVRHQQCSRSHQQISCTYVQKFSSLVACLALKQSPHSVLNLCEFKMSFSVPVYSSNQRCYHSGLVGMSVSFINYELDFFKPW